MFIIFIVFTDLLYAYYWTSSIVKGVFHTQDVSGTDSAPFLRRLLIQILIMLIFYFMLLTTVGIGSGAFCNNGVYTNN